MLHSGNGLVFGAMPFVAVVNRWKLEQEYIAPYTPEPNGMMEPLFGSVKSEWVWLHRFRDVITPSGRSRIGSITITTSDRTKRSITYAEGVPNPISGVSCPRTGRTPHLVGLGFLPATVQKGTLSLGEVSRRLDASKIRGLVTLR